ncbi:MAG: DUF86 domain-containing protein [Cyanobacteria bacterium P01_A01_bin.105]
MNILREIKDSVTLEKYLTDRRQQLIVERLLHLVVEAATDTNNHVLSATQQSPPDDYYSSFPEAAKVGLISPDLAARLAPSTGLRNRLVHDYDDLDNVVVYHSIEFALVGYAEYVLHVQDYLAQHQD